ncbi:hypothetical protein D9M73_267930 [compost metagenome]
MLGDQGIARGGFPARNVRYPGNARPDGFRRAGDGHIEVLEKPALLGQAVEVGCRIERVAVGAYRRGAQ